jgi:asparagine synthase (glutamine-hydrolysing)
VVELAQAMPANMKLRGNTTKWALRQLAANKLPKTIVKRPKKGFGVPLAAWLRGPLRGWLTDLLGDQTCAEAGFFDPIVVQKLLREHGDGKADHRKTLWAMASFEAWRRGKGVRA